MEGVIFYSFPSLNFAEHCQVGRRFIFWHLRLLFLHKIWCQFGVSIYYVSNISVEARCMV